MGVSPFFILICAYNPCKFNILIQEIIEIRGLLC